MNQIKVDYRGFQITFQEGSNKDEETWSSELGEEYHERHTMQEIKKKIDTFIKQESEYVNKKAYVTKWGSLIEGCTITSEDRDGEYVWIKDSDGDRSKEDKNAIYVINKSNDSKIAKMKEIESSIDTLKEEKDSIFKSLEKVF